MSKKESTQEYIPYELYTDGGIMGSNPSTVGGTWAWCWVDKQGNRIKGDKGIVTPKMVNMTTISNNFTELLATLKALQSVPKWWKGAIKTDSQVTWHRLNKSKAFEGIPDEFRNAVLFVRENIKYVPILVKGHSKEFPHNEWCDQQCRRVGEDFLQGDYIIDETIPYDYGEQIVTLKRKKRQSLGIFN